MDFEDIRPYNDSEYQSVLVGLLEKPVFIDAIKFYFPELSFTDIQEKLLSFSTIQEFQSLFVCPLVERIIDKTTESISFKGRESLINEESYLYISNHRDIVLDSALLNFGLNEVSLKISEIAIGNNLLSVPWVKDTVRLNKSFIVKRDVPKQQSLETSKVLSAYLHYTLKQKNESIWIAQREGRAKDGFDRTNPGLLKMFGLSSTDQVLDSLKSMNIRPVSISYEYDPCDSLKIPELISLSNGKVYEKSPNEDERHMLTGIRGRKGNVNITFGESINEELNAFEGIKNKNQLLKCVSDLIDKYIYMNYHFWNSNYVAYDILHSSNEFINKYSENDKQKFIDYMREKLIDFSDNKLAKDLFLKMYANPISNFKRVTKQSQKSGELL